jgi:6-phosphogluconate dehydrogenase (decarboxylating)
MKRGIVGFGRMGSNVARRLTRAGHECVAFDMSPRASRGAEDFANKLLSALRFQFGGHEEKHS